MSSPLPSADCFFQKAIGSPTALSLSIGGSSFSSNTGSMSSILPLCAATTMLCNVSVMGSGSRLKS
jgi:hypothetical protein